MMKTKLQKLKLLLSEVNDLESAAYLLTWDQTTYMPAGGAEARGRQISTLTRLAHEKLIDDQVGQLLDELKPDEAELAYDSDEASLIRKARHTYERTRRLPSEFVAEFASHSAKTYELWTKARPANDFALVQPYLEKTLDFSRQYADYFPNYTHIADPLIERYDLGMSVATIRPLFAQLRDELRPLVQTICEQEPMDGSPLHQFYPEQQQLAFSLEAAKEFGYDITRGRQDLTYHPFMVKFSLGDVRITTRINEQNLAEGLFSTLHETGHALYEQGINPAFEATPLAEGTSAGVHESQSRLWENQVGRSLGYWKYAYPQLQAAFPEQLNSVSLDSFYRAINQVKRSLIRTDADEVTYNLHVIIRFELELALLEGSLSVADLPEAWRERYKSDLGVVSPDDKDGVLQDVHWYTDYIGGLFQGYTLGNILAAQFYDAALNAHPHIPAEIEQGRFDTLHNWLRTQIYQHGTKFDTAELVERVTGGPLTLSPYIGYLKTKFGEIYDLT